MSKPINIQFRVAGRGGWLPGLAGESQGRALERIMPRMNAQGYRVAFVVPDQFSFLKRMLHLFVQVFTLGAWYHTEGLLIIGELVDLREST